MQRRRFQQGLKCLIVRTLSRIVNAGSCLERHAEIDETVGALATTDAAAGVDVVAAAGNELMACRQGHLHGTEGGYFDIKAHEAADALGIEVLVTQGDEFRSKG